MAPGAPSFAGLFPPCTQVRTRACHAPRSVARNDAGLPGPHCGGTCTRGGSAGNAGAKYFRSQLVTCHEFEQAKRLRHNPFTGTFHREPRRYHQLHNLRRFRTGSAVAAQRNTELSHTLRLQSARLAAAESAPPPAIAPPSGARSRAGSFPASTTALDRVQPTAPTAPTASPAESETAALSAWVASALSPLGSLEPCSSPLRPSEPCGADTDARCPTAPPGHAAQRLSRSRTCSSSSSTLASVAGRVSPLRARFSSPETEQAPDSKCHAPTNGYPVPSGLSPPAPLAAPACTAHPSPLLPVPTSGLALAQWDLGAPAAQLQPVFSVTPPRSFGTPTRGSATLERLDRANPVFSPALASPCAVSPTHIALSRPMSATVDASALPRFSAGDKRCPSAEPRLAVPRPLNPSADGAASAPAAAATPAAPYPACDVSPLRPLLTHRAAPSVTGRLSVPLRPHRLTLPALDGSALCAGALDPSPAVRVWHGLFMEQTPGADAGTPPPQPGTVADGCAGGGGAAACSMSELDLGDVLKPWAINRCAPLDTAYALAQPHPMGSGSFAAVYKAVHRATGKAVALKAIERRFLISEEEKASVKREVELHLRLVHPHIARLYEVYETPTHLYLVLEYADKGTLKNVRAHNLA